MILYIYIYNCRKRKSQWDFLFVTNNKSKLDYSQKLWINHIYEKLKLNASVKFEK